MSATWKGFGGITLVSQEPVLDAETGVEYEDRLWVGPKAAIYGHGVVLKNSNISFRISHVTGPVYSIASRIPVSDPTIEDPDRYEITTEGQEKSIFELPGIVTQAGVYDGAIAAGAKTYREKAEEAVSQKSGTLGNGTDQNIFDELVRNLKAGVTGFQIDFVVLRRFRKIDLSYAYAAGKITLDGGLIFYTTNQLNLPAGVAFSLPATPYTTSSDYQWGWRKRGQRVEIIGDYAEQTVELVFAPWSLLVYAQSGSDLAW